MPLLDFHKLDDVIAQANNTRYGLAAFAFTNDITAHMEIGRGPRSRALSASTIPCRQRRSARSAA